MQSTTPRRSLQRLLPLLDADPRVMGIHLCGSMSRDEDDEVSDIDLWVQADEWNPAPLLGRLVALQQLQLNGRPMSIGVDVDGTIIDLLHGPEVPAWYVPVERQPLPSAVTEGNDATATPNGNGNDFGLVEDFWLTTLKHRKCIWRGQHGVVSYGLHLDRKTLLRAWSLKESGEDPGELGFGMFTLRTLTERFLNPERLELLGLPTRNEQEIETAVRAYRDEMSHLFPSPTALETIVRSLPMRPI